MSDVGPPRRDVGIAAGYIVVGILIILGGALAVRWPANVVVIAIGASNFVMAGRILLRHRSR